MPDPAVPPTPPVPLAALLAREDLALRQIAGPVDPAAVIHWAHTSEMADPYPYLLGGELLLTAGVHVPEAAGSGAYFDDYVARIVAAGGAALGFGLAPVHDTVPRALVAACEAYELPLIEVPPQTTFSGVARAVWQLMAQARLAELRRVTEAQQSLAAAASRPDPVPSVLRQLAQRLGGRAVLYGPEGTEIAGAGRLAGSPAADQPPPGAERVVGSPAADPPAAGAAARRPAQATAPGGPPEADVPPALAELAELAQVVRPSGPGIPTSATHTAAGVHLAAYALGAGQGFVLGVAAPTRAPGDHTIASVAAVLLSLLTGEHQSGSGAARSSALVRLLLGAAPQEVAGLLGSGRWVVVHAIPSAQAGAAADATSAARAGAAAGATSAARAGAATGAAPDTRAGAAAGAAPDTRAGAATPAHAPSSGPDAVAASALGAALGSPLVDLATDVVRVLLPAEREPAAPHPGWALGVSAPVEPYDWPLADAQAARALARARATRSDLVRHGGRPGLAALVPPDEAEAHARALLAPIADSPALLDTLRTWLSLHGSWDRTAVALAVHRNTVRQRVAKCAALLDADLDDPDVRMELWFALRE
nr:PucR family transcriptional regulator [Streptomyces antibioticus]